GARHPRPWPGDCAREPAAALRSLLHHQAAGRGHRPRPRRDLRDRARAERQPACLQSRAGRRLLRSGAAPRPRRRMTARGARPLVIDDDPGLAEVLELLFPREGYAAERADTVQKALARAREASFDLVITDLRLPDGTGLDVIRALRE